MMTTLLITVSLLVICITANPDEDLQSGYGDEWLLYHDENGEHIMNFSTAPRDTRDMTYGDAYYYLYTRRNVIAEQLIFPTGTNDNITSEFFNASNSIKVITHGWLTKEKVDWLQNIKDEFLIKDDYNVITIDWSELSINAVYPWSAYSVRYVGRKTARFLEALAMSYGIEGSNVHLIGHSLGAHVMAQTAMFLNYRIHRITGLDPARPLFEVPMMPPHARLDDTDAEFVDIIHTSAGLLGYNSSHGHADFYPNGGVPPQKGCEGINSKMVACSHGRANLYFKESVNAKALFRAYSCESWEAFKTGSCKKNHTHMGNDAKIGDAGNYYLNTNAEPPYVVEEV